MSFRWRRHARHADICVGVLDDVVLALSQDHRQLGDVRMRVLNDASPERQARALDLVRSHLSLDRGCDAKTHWQQCGSPRVPERFHAAAAALPGVRVLSIANRLEALVTFIGSANNNIKRNMQMVEALCAAFPENRLCGCPFGGELVGRTLGGEPAHFRFPSLDQLLTLSEADLWALGWGYRAPRLYTAVRELEQLGGVAFLESLAELSDDDACAQLCMLHGIGRKVADCILLFGYGRDGVVPVDTHCLQLARRYFLPSSARDKGLSTALYSQIVRAFADAFGEAFAGWAFMTLFVAELSDFRKIVAEVATASPRISSSEATAASPRKTGTSSEYFDGRRRTPQKQLARRRAKKDQDSPSRLRRSVRVACARSAFRT